MQAGRYAITPTGAWPPAWDPAAGAATPVHSPAGTAASRGYPPPSWPTKDQLDYTNKAVTALLLVLALPWLSYKLVTRPADVLEAAGRGRVTGA